jgi:glycosyltransferase involved in cell wall biosynthesis
LRALLVLGYSLPTQQALWEEAARKGVDLHVAYTLEIPRAGGVAPPAFGTPHELSAIRVRGDRQTWMAYRGLASLIRGLRPDIVHVLNEPWSIVASQARRAGGGSLITHGCENLWAQGSKPEVALRQVMAGRNLRASAGFVSWNRQGVEWARAWGLPPESSELVLSAELPRLERFSDSQSLRSAGHSTWGLSDEFTVGYVGRLVQEKGIDWLLESWQTANLPDDAQLVFVGEGPLERNVRAAAVVDPRIRMLGPVPFEQVPTVMATLDVLALPSLTTPTWCEQYGRVITEAMASGVPVIASSTGAIPDVVGQAGLLVPEASVSDLAEAMVSLEADRQRRSRLGSMALERAATAFSPSIGADTLTTWWQCIVDGEGR